MQDLEGEFARPPKQQDIPIFLDSPFMASMGWFPEWTQTWDLGSLGSSHHSVQWIVGPLCLGDLQQFS